MFANSERKEILEKWMKPDSLPASEFKSEVYQLQILQSRMEEQWVLQQNQKQVKEYECFLRSTNTECNIEPVSKGCLQSTIFALPLNSDNDPRLELNVGPQAQKFLRSTSSAALLTNGNSQSRGTHLAKNLDIILSLASPPPSPPPYPPPPSPPLPSPSPPHSPSPSHPSFPSQSGSRSPSPGYPPRSPPHSPLSEPSPTPPPSPPPLTPSPSPVPPPTAAIFPTPPDSPEFPPLPLGSPPEAPPLPPGSPPEAPPLSDSHCPYPPPDDPPWI